MQFSVSRVSMWKTVTFQTIQFSISMQFKCKYIDNLSKTFLFQAIRFSQTVLIQKIQFSISMQLVLFNPYIWPYQALPFRARVDLGAIAMKRCFGFPKTPASTEVSPSDHLVSYPGHSLGVSYSSAEMLSVYSTAPADWANVFSGMTHTNSYGTLTYKRIT